MAKGGLYSTPAVGARRDVITGQCWQKHLTARMVKKLDLSASETKGEVARGAHRSYKESLGAVEGRGSSPTVLRCRASRPDVDSA